MPRLFALIGALLFVGSQIYFVFSYAVRFGADAPFSVGVPAAIGVDVLMFSLFALHHSLFARIRLKTWIDRFAGRGLERPIYVWISSVGFLLLCFYWQPVAGLAWRATGAAAALLELAQCSGVVLTVAAARQLDVLALAGLRPHGRADAIVDTRLYRLVRHPIYLGWFLFVWCAPLMNGTRLVFAVVSCLYLLAAVEFEERDLRRTFGQAYERYESTVRWKIVPGVY
jgi:protein-S-isoprenylcysteine O-methyltransferase Ste14